jgi:NAD(P)-dependent dehydrogenase (short-subunit alcohol dehydrogenase family)
MPEKGAVVIVGGTSGAGRGIAQHYADRDREVVITGRDAQSAQDVARQIGGRTRGLGFDLAEPETIAVALSDVGPVHDLVLAAIERDYNTVLDYDVARARRLVTLKLVGYTEVVHVLASRLEEDGCIVLFGGLAKDRPYPGSTTVTTVNHGISGLTRTLARELAPIRVNAIHPGVQGDSPHWTDKPEALEMLTSRTPLGRLITTDEVVSATVFLVEHPSVNGINLNVDGGWLIT